MVGEKVSCRSFELCRFGFGVHVDGFHPSEMDWHNEGLLRTSQSLLGSMSRLVEFAQRNAETLEGDLARISRGIYGYW